MPSQKSSSPPPETWTSTLALVAVIVALLSALFFFLDSHLDWFYIFTPSELHDLSLRAIGAHGNDTRAVVGFIVAELSEKLPGGYVNLDEEWIFNNAGGAMGAMYIIHASEYTPLIDYPGSKMDQSRDLWINNSLLIDYLGITEYLIIFGLQIFLPYQRSVTYHPQVPLLAQKVTQAATQPTITSIS